MHLIKALSAGIPRTIKNIEPFEHIPPSKVAEEQCAAPPPRPEADICPKLELIAATIWKFMFTEVIILRFAVHSEVLMAL